MDKFYLFRLKLVSKKGQELLDGGNKGELLRKAIMLSPGAVVRKGIEWIMANTDAINDEAVFLKFGRLTKKTRDKYDPERRMFIETEDDMVDCAKCIYDSKYQLLAIEKRSNTPSPSRLSKYFAQIINCIPDGPLFQQLSEVDRRLLKLCICQADAISNPVNFIEQMQHAHRVLEFDVTFFRKNPPDFEELLQRPMQQFLEETGGDISIAGVKSEDGLQSDKLVEITHAAAASGSNAHAWIQKEPGLRSEKIMLKTKFNVADIAVEPDDYKDNRWLSRLLSMLRDGYISIRGANNG